MIEWRERISPKIFSPSNQAVCHLGNPPFSWMMRIYPQGSTNYKHFYGWMFTEIYRGMRREVGKSGFSA